MNPSPHDTLSLYLARKPWRGNPPPYCGRTRRPQKQIVRGRTTHRKTDRDLVLVDVQSGSMSNQDDTCVQQARRSARQPRAARPGRPRDGSRTDVTIVTPAPPRHAAATRGHSKSATFGQNTASTGRGVPEARRGSSEQPWPQKQARRPRRAATHRLVNEPQLETNHPARTREGRLSDTSAGG